MSSSDELRYIDSVCGLSGVEIKEAASRIARLLEEIDPLILEDTALVCPRCTEVCCISRHGRYAFDDLVFLTALGKKIAVDGNCLPWHMPCHYLGSGGCVLPRVMRPYRCTWYFCDSLMKETGAKGPRQIRDFYALLRKITAERSTMLELFAAAEKRAGREFLRSPFRPDDPID